MNAFWNCVWTSLFRLLLLSLITVQKKGCDKVQAKVIKCRNFSFNHVNLQNIGYKKWFQIPLFLTLTPFCFMMFQNHRKVSFWIASEASYFYSLSGRKFIENAKPANLTNIWKPEACSQTVLPDRLILNRTNIGVICQNWKLQMQHFE